MQAAIQHLVSYEVICQYSRQPRFTYLPFSDGVVAADSSSVIHNFILHKRYSTIKQSAGSPTLSNQSKVPNPPRHLPPPAICALPLHPRIPSNLQPLIISMHLRTHLMFPSLLIRFIVTRPLCPLISSSANRCCVFRTIF